MTLLQTGLLSLLLAMLTTKFLDADAIIAGAPQNLRGKPFPDAPKRSVGSRYKFDNGFYVGADAKYTSCALFRFGNFILFTYLSSRWTVDMQAGYKIGYWEINAFAENLLDEKILCFRGKGCCSNSWGRPEIRSQCEGEVLNDRRYLFLEEPSYANWHSSCRCANP